MRSAPIYHVYIHRSQSPRGRWQESGSIQGEELAIAEFGKWDRKNNRYGISMASQRICLMRSHQSL